MEHLDLNGITEVSIRHDKLLQAKEEFKELHAWKKGFEAAGKNAPTTYRLEEFFSLLERNLLENLHKKNKALK